MLVPLGVPATIADPPLGRVIALEGLILVCLFILYFYTLINWEWIGLRVGDVIALGSIAGSLSWLAFPVNSTDLFSYLGFGRLIALYHLNPYTHGYADILDSFSPYPKWESSMPYGPMLLPVFAAAGLVSSSHLILGLYFLKLEWLALYAANGWLLCKILRHLDLDTAKNLFVYLLNPLILLELGINGHNDVVVIFMLLLCIVLVNKERFGVAFLVAIVAALVKPVALLLIAAVASLAIRRQHIREIAMGTAVAIVALVALKLSLFPTNQAIQNLLNPVPVNSYSFHSVLLQGWYSQFGQVPSSESINAAYREPGARILRIGLTAGFALWCLWRLAGIRTRADIPRQMAFMILMLLLGYSASIYPWYVTWIIPLAAMTFDRRLRTVILAYSCTVLLLYIPWTMFLSFEGRLSKLLAAHGVVFALLFLPARRVGAHQSAPTP